MCDAKPEVMVCSSVLTLTRDSVGLILHNVDMKRVNFSEEMVCLVPLRFLTRQLIELRYMNICIYILKK